MPLFEIPNTNRISKTADSKVAKKSNSKGIQSKSVRVGNSLLARINEIKAIVEKNLGQFKDDYLILNVEDRLHDYITECIGNEYISIDTETTGLDPLRDALVGICPYTRGQKGAYIPLNHISYVTGVKADNQLSIDFVMREFKRLLEKKPYIDMFNAKFDIRFLRANGLPDIYCNWDGYLASQILNENEITHGLKPLHKKYVLNGKGDAFSFDELFKGITFDKIPINVGYLYAAHDPVITTELNDYQRKYLRLDSDREDIRNMAWVFHNIEMPCINVVADMEDNGVEFDMNYQQELSIKYNALLKEKEEDFYTTLKSYQKEIIIYRKAHEKDCKLSDPVNIASPTQIAVLLYDILNVGVIDQKSPRGTGEAILAKIDNPICKAILDYREISKLITTYIDKLPDCVNPKDGRIHCSFNQYGAKTGRFSSSDPNLQNIPSRNHDIRKMFIASNDEFSVDVDDNSICVYMWDEVMTSSGWICAHNIKIGDAIEVDSDEECESVIVKNIKVKDQSICFVF